MATTTSDERVKGALSYLLGPITGIVFLLIEKENQFIRFHAMQSTLVFGAILLINIVLGIVPILGWIIAVILSPFLVIVFFVLWLLLMWKAYSGEKYKLPYDKALERATYLKSMGIAKYGTVAVRMFRTVYKMRKQWAINKVERDIANWTRR